ncbi:MULTISPECIES: tRNA-Val4 [Rossellomorea]|uniref:tRNA-Val4 n=1 Tax=Rossellomorea TaxID=2837508 RepID=UPI0013183177|nr:tRNA-Val4 [Rossellomorea marisflavi]QHA37873.1 tRNA-Val4 [Rossellomorea marisflavi]USK91784.1 tRNA-Val4 [Rossellomorea marisflavi]
MKYLYEFKEDPFGDLMLVLPEELSVFSDFIQDITSEEEADEYIGYVKNVLEGINENFEITLNATSVMIKKDFTIAEHHYRIDEHCENKIETEEFLDLLIIWKEKILEIF